MKITVESNYSIIVEDPALNQYEADLNHTMTWAEFKVYFPNHPLTGVKVVNFHPDDSLFHVGFKTGEVIAETDPQDNTVLKWFDDNKTAIRQTFVDDIIAKNPTLVDFYNIDIDNL